jgi:chromosome segregation ATPase
MSFLKNIFGKKEDDVPEMHVRSNEPKPYWSKEHKCWMIPGQEEDKIKELAETKKGPPKKIGSNAERSAAAMNMPVQRDITKTVTKKKVTMANRYASALPTENLAEVKEEIKEVSQVRQETVVESNEGVEATMSNTMFYSVQENIHNVPNDSQGQNNQLDNVEASAIKITEESTLITHTENFPLNSVDFQNQNFDKNNLINENNFSNNNQLSDQPYNNQQLNPSYLKEFEEKIRKDLEEEYNKRLSEMESIMGNQIVELKETLQFIEENAEEETAIMKNQLNTFIKENLELKFDNERTLDELSFKQKEVEQYQTLLENMRNNLSHENENIPHKSSEEKKDDASNPFSESQNADDYIFINSKIEKLEYDKLIINTDLAEAKREISNLNLEKSFLEYKLKEIESNYTSNSEKLRDNYINLEKKFLDLEMSNKILQKNKELLEKETKRNEELNRLNEDLLKKLNENNNQLNEIKLSLEKSNNEIKNLSQSNHLLSEESNRLKKIVEDKDLNYSKVIRDLRSRLNEYKVELDRLRDLKEESKSNNYISPEVLKSFENKINESNEKMFKYEKNIFIYTEMVTRLKNFTVDCLENLSKEIENPEKLSVSIERLKNINKNSSFEQFDVELSLALKVISNEFINRQYEKNLFKKEKSLLNEEIQNLKIENEILNLSRKDIQNDNLRIKDEIQETIEKFEKELSSKNELIEKLQDENRSIQINASDKETISTLEKQIEELNALSDELNSRLNYEINENEFAQNKITDLVNENQLLTIELKDMKEQYFTLSFTNEKISQEISDREYLLSQIISDINTTINTHNNQESNDESNYDDTFIEAKIANKIRILSNLLEKIKCDNNLLSSELNCIKEEIERTHKTNSFLEEELKNMKSRNMYITQENKNLKNNNLSLTENMKNLEREIEDVKASNIQANLVDPEVLQEKQREIETLREKMAKLKELLDSTKTYYENGIENLKNKQKQKMAEIKSSIEELQSENSLLKEKSDEKYNQIVEENVKLRETLDSVLPQLKSHQEFEANLIKTNLPLLNKYNLKTDSFDKKSLVIPKLIENLSRDIVELKEKDSSVSNIIQEHEHLSKKVDLLGKEQEVLLENLNGKNREIDELKNNSSDMESQVEKLRTSLDETNRNYENLLRNHKSAEKLNELQKKIQHLIEEKSTLQTSHGLIVENLTKEIKSLTEKLNEYQKKELELEGNVVDQKKSSNVEKEELSIQEGKNINFKLFFVFRK